MSKSKLTHDEACDLRCELEYENPNPAYLAAFLEGHPDTKETAVLEMPLLNLYLEKQRELIALHAVLFTCVKDLEYSRHEEVSDDYEELEYSRHEAVPDEYGEV